MRFGSTAAAAVLATSLLTMASAQAKERHYDCTKPGNANKAVCKAAAAQPPAAAPAAAPAPTMKASTTRQYDCSKAGNANKAVCKGAAAAAPTVASAPTAPAAAQPSIFSRLRRAAAAPASAPAPQVAAAPTVQTSSYRGKSITTDPAGATGQCKDGSYTHATHHSGACSSHGGVAKWLNG